jgi:DNA-directed RNA polymerase subunit N
MIPVRCFTCGKPIAHLYEKYKELVKKGEKPEKAFEKLGIRRYCCKGLMTSHSEMIDKTAIYKKF